jgi:hypothetical protein
LLHCCYTVVTLLLHCCYTVVTLLSHCCYTAVTLLSHSCSTVVDESRFIIIFIMTTQICDGLQMDRRLPQSQLRVIALHGSTTHDDREVFIRPPAGVRKVRYITFIVCRLLIQHRLNESASWNYGPCNHLS